MFLIPDCSDRTARKIDKHVLSVPLTLMMGRRYFLCRVGSTGTASVLKIDIPKGSIITPEDSECMRFVAGDLLNLAIKPLNLGDPEYEEFAKRDCIQITTPPCSGGCSSCSDATKEEIRVMSQDNTTQP